MKIDLDAEDIELIVKALENYAAYLHAMLRDGRNYEQLAERLKKLKP
jgi:hypothetical protein